MTTKHAIDHSSIVEASFLFENKDNENLIVLDATNASPGQKDFMNPTVGIPGAIFIDIKNDFSDVNAPYPNTLLDEKAFTQAAQALGINDNSHIVVYDQKGTYSSPRVYWMFRVMGHKNIRVLNGGINAWLSEDYPAGAINQGPFQKGNFVAKLNKNLLVTKEDILASLENNSLQVLDARSAGRFNGTAPEPRKNTRSGRIPKACNLPHTVLKKDGKLLDVAALKKHFEQLVTEDKPLVFSCGSGITACILFLAAEIAGYEDIAVYDGSWSEWGEPSELPVEV